jgi:hypothetical protein
MSSIEDTLRQNHSMFYLHQARLQCIMPERFGFHPLLFEDVPDNHSLSRFQGQYHREMEVGKSTAPISIMISVSNRSQSSGSRFVFAATDHLHKKMSKLEARMHSLEDAIAILYANTSDQPHPLLTPRVDDDDDDGPILKPVIEETEAPGSVLADSLGSLHLDSRGGARFFGPSGGSEVCQVESLALALPHLLCY